MSLKAKLASTIAAVCMVICLLSVGIFAATTAKIGLSGTVSFVAQDVNVVVAINVYNNGARENAVKTDSITINADAPEAATAFAAEKALGDISFTKDGNGGLNAVEVVLTITNKGTKGANVTSAAGTLTEGTGEAIDVDYGSATLAAGVGETATLVIKITSKTDAGVEVSAAKAAWAAVVTFAAA